MADWILAACGVKRLEAIDGDKVKQRTKQATLIIATDVAHGPVKGFFQHFFFVRPLPMLLHHWVLQQFQSIGRGKKAADVTLGRCRVAEEEQ